MSLDYSAIRCMLFVPGNRPDRFQKAVAASPDGVILDLEDAVGPGEKDAARRQVGAFLAERAKGAPVLVRINALGTPAALADLLALADGSIRPDGLLLPKVEDRRDLDLVRATLGSRLVPMLGLIETVRGLRHVDAIAEGFGADGAIAFGGADLSAELGCDFAWEPLLLARCRVVAAAAGAGIPAFDVPFLGIKDEAGLIAETERVRALGFAAKLAIHPAQVAPIAKAFSPSPEAVAAARRIVEAFEAATGEAIQVDGKMVDVPLYKSAQRTLKRA
ncbi:MAG: CoA ester lyase [Parvibaculaceae bacterium]